MRCNADFRSPSCFTVNCNHILIVSASDFIDPIYICLNLDPAENGNRDQIITMWHDMPERELLATNFYEWFSQYEDDVISGYYVYHKDYNVIVSKNDI